MIKKYKNDKGTKGLSGKKINFDMQKMLGDPEFRNIIKKDGNILEIFR